MRQVWPLSPRYIPHYFSFGPDALALARRFYFARGVSGGHPNRFLFALSPPPHWGSQDRPDGVHRPHRRSHSAKNTGDILPRKIGDVTVEYISLKTAATRRAPCRT
jgi:hypothetical protein